jgi:hypothetical protein
VYHLPGTMHARIEPTAVAGMGERPVDSVAESGSVCGGRETG